MSDAPQPKKRRRRLATPPPAEKDKEDVEEKDFYDKTVSSTYDALKSGQIEVPEMRTTAIPDHISRSNSASSGENLVDLDESDLAGNEPVTVVLRPDQVIPTEVVEEDPIEEAPSPPPPVLVSRPRRLGNGVRAAFDKLEKSRMQEHVQTIQDYHEEYREAAMDAQCVGSSEPQKIRIRVKMPSGIQKYEMKLTDRLFTLKEEIAKRESVSADRVTMFCNDNAIHTEDTVKGLGLTVADTVEAYVLSEEVAASAVENTDNSSDTLSIKVQGRGKRETVNIPILPSDTMDVLMRKFAEHKQVEVSTLTFHFDGDELSASDTPTDLDMEDGDCVDVTGC